MDLLATPTTSISMNNSIKDDTHDLLVKAFLRYSEANSRFDLYGYSKSAVKARGALLEIQRLIKLRRTEIMEKKIEMHGHPRKGITPTAPSERRQRKIDRQRQKQQAENQEGTN